MVDRNDPAEFADEHADVRHESLRRISPRSRFNHKWRHEAGKGDDARRRKMVLQRKRKRRVDALAFVPSTTHGSGVLERRNEQRGRERGREWRGGGEGRN